MISCSHIEMLSKDGERVMPRIGSNDIHKVRAGRPDNKPDELELILTILESMGDLNFKKSNGHRDICRTLGNPQKISLLII